MPNDTLDEIEARWKQHRWISPNSGSRAIGDIRTLVEMVRTRDRLLLRVVGVVSWCVGWINAADEGAAAYPDRELKAIQAALDTPPAQEPKE